MTYSLLDDPIIRVRTGDYILRECSLPVVLTHLMHDDIVSFEALQPHQQQPWFCFLVQCAAMGIAREFDGKWPSNASEWHSILLGLTQEIVEAWSLVVEDPTMPAFMQPPVTNDSLVAAGYRQDIATPDDLDMLVTSRNHDVKMGRIRYPRPEHWIYALVTVQTMEGSFGRGNYGIIRMNKGYGNRPAVGYAPSLSWGTRFLRDVKVLIEERKTFATRYNLNGTALMWLVPWDGSRESAIPLSQCDPYFIEVCRRLRLQLPHDDIVGFRANSRGQRMATPDDFRGFTGDPWTPVQKKEAKALTVGESGFAYDLLQEILFGGEYWKPIALKFRKTESRGAFVIARALARGEGGTDGLHNRVIFVPARVSDRLFSDGTQRARLAERAQQRVRIASDVQRKVLYPAIAALLSKGLDKQVKWQQGVRWLDAFDRDVDARFFDSLWDSIEIEDDVAQGNWEKILLQLAEEQLNAAEQCTPNVGIHRWRAVSKARSVFYGGARTVFEYALQSKPRRENING